MEMEHVISDEVLNIATAQLAHGNSWLAYNQTFYFIDKADIFFFKTAEEANEFADNNISDFDCFHVIQFHSIPDLLSKVTYEEQLSINLKTNVMNEENFEYLSKQLKYTGFPEEMSAVLQRHLEAGQREFNMGLSSVFGNDKVESTLHFSRSTETDRYFFNRYEMSAQKEGQPHTQTFYIDQKGGNITLKEGYNLINGRSVYKELHTKEGEKYNAWVQMDFKETDKYGNFKLKKYNENYGYNLEKTLEQHPIKELADLTQKERLMQSLERGNRQNVTFEAQGKEHKVSVEAVPQYKSLNFYDEQGKKLNVQQLLKPAEEKKTLKQNNAQRQKQGQHM